MFAPLADHRSRALAAVVTVFVAFSLVLSGCPLDFGDLEEPEIIDVTVIPSEICEAETDEQDEHFTIDITIANFEDEVEDATAFLGEEEREAPVDHMEVVDDNVISLQEIRFSWLAGRDADIDDGDMEVHDVGVEVSSSTESALAFRVATITIHDDDSENCPRDTEE